MNNNHVPFTCPKCKSQVVTVHNITIEPQVYTILTCENAHLTLYLMNVEFQQGQIGVTGSPDVINFVVLSPLTTKSKIIVPTLVNPLK